MKTKKQIDAELMRLGGEEFEKHEDSFRRQFYEEGIFFSELPHQVVSLLKTYFAAGYVYGHRARDLQIVKLN